MQQKEKAIKVGTLVSLGIALAAAGVFLAVTSAGDYSVAARYGGAGCEACAHGVPLGWAGYSVVARYGGAAWVFLLALIVAMPVVLPLFKRRMGS
ncbi:MAG: hypothetical protein HY684_00770 [Chloroflexi bacterium]|nr:hypothetical protein [Chloroflexota bacterium]